jgi:ketosteroid isomerase-like protein
MKKMMCFVAFAGAVFVTGCQQLGYQENDSVQCQAAEKAVLETHAALIAVAENRDVETMFSYILENDKGAIIQDGQLMSRQEALEQIRRGFGRVTQIDYDFKQRNIKMLSPTIALMTASGTTTSTIDTGESFTSTFANTSVFVRQDDGWKIIHGHHSIPNP